MGIDLICPFRSMCIVFPPTLFTKGESIIHEAFCVCSFRSYIIESKGWHQYAMSSFSFPFFLFFFFLRVMKRQMVFFSIDAKGKKKRLPNLTVVEASLTGFPKADLRSYRAPPQPPRTEHVMNSKFAYAECSECVLLDWLNRGGLTETRAF